MSLIAKLGQHEGQTVQLMAEAGGNKSMGGSGYIGVLTAVDADSVTVRWRGGHAVVASKYVISIMPTAPISLED